MEGRATGQGAGSEVRAPSTPVKAHPYLSTPFTLHREVATLKEEVQKTRSELEASQSELATMEVRAREREKEATSSMNHMQQELAKRAKQVGGIKNHKMVSKKC